MRGNDSGGERLLWQYTKAGFAVGVVEQQELAVQTDARGVVVSSQRHGKGDGGPNLALQDFAERHGKKKAQPSSGSSETQYLGQ